MVFSFSFFFVYLHVGFFIAYDYIKNPNIQNYKLFNVLVK